MRIEEIGEFGLVERIASMLRARSPEVLRGIGDDAAVIDLGDGRALILTIDSLVEGVHFLKDVCPPRSIGYKSMAVNVSDVAAMGAEPKYGVVSISLPEGEKVELVEGIYRGIEEMASEVGVSVVGGDTTRSPGPLFISIALLGVCPVDEVIGRSEAKAGDLIGVTGTLGDSAAGLELILKGEVEGLKPEDAEYLLDRHLRPKVRTKAARELASRKLVSSMIDISDGLSSEVNHICRMSGVGALIEAERLPISDQLQRFCELTGRSALDLALNGGEDYELLFTFPRGNLGEIEAAFERLGLRLSVVGRVTPPDEGVRIKIGGEERPLPPGGFDHWGGGERKPRPRRSIKPCAAGRSPF